MLKALAALEWGILLSHVRNTLVTLKRPVLLAVTVVVLVASLAVLLTA